MMLGVLYFIFTCSQFLITDFYYYIQACDEKEKLNTYNYPIVLIEILEKWDVICEESGDLYKMRIEIHNFLNHRGEC